MTALIVNCIAGPGAGKSSLTASIFAGLKWADVNCEMALEFAKDVVWEESYNILTNQVYVFAQQLQRLHRLEEKVDVIITDSPLLLSIAYGEHYAIRVPALKSLVLEEHRRRSNINFFIKRVKPYRTAGRMQTEDEASALDGTIKNLLDTYGEPYIELEGKPESAAIAVDII